jgi:transposase
MGQSFSLDLRNRIVSRVGTGRSRRNAADHFGVSPSCAVKLLQRVKKTGSPAPARQGRPPGGGKLAPHRDFLIEYVRTRSDITMPELATVLLKERGVKAAPSSLSRLLRKAGFSYKKSVDGFGARTRRRC